MKWIVLSVLLGLAVLLPTGCSSTPEAVATQAAGTQVLTVDAAMKGWADWVNQGRATQEQVDKVRDLYMTYYIAAKAEEKALIAYVGSSTNNPASVDWPAAARAVQAAQADLLALIVHLQGK
jgi:hypothetical protein